MSIIINVVTKPQFVYRLAAIRRANCGKILSRRVSEYCPNVFTNHGVEQLFGGAQGGSQIGAAVGTGSSEFSIEDTRLNNFLAGVAPQGRASGSFTNNGDGTGFFEYTKDSLFPVGVATGNISEIGASFTGPVNENTDLASLALVVDGNGNPTVFEVLSDEELLLTKIFRMNIGIQQTVIDDVPVSGDGPNQRVTISPFALNSAPAWPRSWNLNTGAICYLYAGEVYNLPDPTSGNRGNSSGAGQGGFNSGGGGASHFTSPYIAGSKQREYGGGLGTGQSRNIVGIEFTMPGFPQYAMKIEPGIPKSELHRFSASIVFKIDNTP